jgi:hypothetical protein
MGVTTKKYGVSVSFCLKLAIFDKTVEHLCISSKNVIFLKPVKIHIRDHYGKPIHNMGVTTKKYRVSVSFCPKLVIFGKTVG